MRIGLTTLPAVLVLLACGTRGAYIMHERMLGLRIELSTGNPALVSATVPDGFDFPALVIEGPRFGVASVEMSCSRRDSLRTSARLSGSQSGTAWSISLVSPDGQPRVSILQKGLSWVPDVSLRVLGDTCEVTLSAEIENLTSRSWLFDELVLLEPDGNLLASAGSGCIPPGRRSYPVWTGRGRLLTPVLDYGLTDHGRWSLLQPVSFQGVAVPVSIEGSDGRIVTVSQDTIWIIPEGLDLQEASRTAGVDTYEYRLDVRSYTATSVTIRLSVPPELASGAVLVITSPDADSLEVGPGEVVSVTATLGYPRGRSYSP